jgi:hypothetical protein
MAQVSQVSAQQKHTIDQKLQVIKDRRNNGNYFKIQSGEKRILMFDVDKNEPVLTKIGDKEVERWRFVCKDPNQPDQTITWDTSYTNADTILNYMKEGITTLTIRREGSEKQTRYYIVPAGLGN